MNAPELSVIVPAYNEVESLAIVVEDAARVLADRMGDRAEVIIVDDGSTDGTAEVAGGLRAAARCAAVVRHPENRGLGVALRSGYAAASGDLAGWIPGDGQFLAEDLLSLLPYAGEADIVLGPMRLTHRQAADGLRRVLLSQGFRLATRLILGEAPQPHGLILFRRKLLAAIGPASATGFLNLELPLAARRRGIPVCVAPILVIPRQRLHGRSKVANLRTMLIVLGDMARFRWRNRWR